MVSLALPIQVRSLFSEKVLRQSFQRKRERERVRERERERGREGEREREKERRFTQWEQAFVVFWKRSKCLNPRDSPHCVILVWGRRIGCHLKPRKIWKLQHASGSLFVSDEVSKKRATRIELHVSYAKFENYLGKPNSLHSGSLANRPS